MSRPATAAVRMLSGEREPVRVATTGNIDLYGLETIDGIALAVADRVLVKDQTDARENGIYTCSAGRWYRASDANHPRAITEGVTVQAQEGTANGGKAYRFRDTLPTIGTDDILIDFYLSANFAEDAEAALDDLVENVAVPIRDEILGFRDLIAGLASDAVSQGNVPIYATVVGMSALEIPVGINAVRVNGYSAAGDGGGALYKRAVSEPVHAGKFQSADGAWWEITSEWLKPEQFGGFGADAAADTTAWEALVSVVNARGVGAKIRMERDQYLINGTGVEDDAQTFKDLPSVWVRYGVDTEHRQRTALAKTLKFLRIGKVKVTGGTQIGFAQTQIDASQPLTELDLDLSSGNAVAAIFARDCELVYTARHSTRNHFGRDVIAFDCDEIRIVEPDYQGVGSDYNRPVIDGHQGNGEDASIYAIPQDLTSGGSTGTRGTGKAWSQKLIIQGGKIGGHSFGFRTILNGLLQVHGVNFTTAPGQHHGYDSDSDGISLIGNTFGYCRQFAFKMQFENLAGFSVGPAFAASTFYAKGDVVRAFSILWVAKADFTSGASFSSANWDQHPRFLRRGGVVTGNIFDGCGYNVGWVASSAVDARNIWSEGLVVRGNTMLNTLDQHMQLDRTRKATIADNKAIGGTASYAVLGKDFSGSFENNDFRDTKSTAILTSLAGTTTFENNKVWDCGLLGADDQNKAPIVIYERGANDPPDFQASPTVFFDGNKFLFTTGDAAGPYLLLCNDARVNWSITGTDGTATTKLFRIAGTVLHKLNNHFPGYWDTAQNPATFTLTNWSTNFAYDANGAATDQADATATLISMLANYRIIKTN